MKPTTSVMLQGQQQLIDNMKLNFEQEMVEVKNQMMQQQQLFKQQMDNLMMEQKQTQQQKMETEAQMN